MITMKNNFKDKFWLDEYKNTVHPDMIGLLKNLYDGIGYERAQMSQDNRTTSNPVLSSAIVSGQDMPTVDPALFTRVILLMFKNNEFKEEDRLAYNSYYCLYHPVHCYCFKSLKTICPLGKCSIYPHK